MRRDYFLIILELFDQCQNTSFSLNYIMKKLGLNHIKAQQLVDKMIQKEYIEQTLTNNDDNRIKNEYNLTYKGHLLMSEMNTLKNKIYD